MRKGSMRCEKGRLPEFRIYTLGMGYNYQNMSFELKNEIIIENKVNKKLVIFFLKRPIVVKIEVKSMILPGRANELSAYCTLSLSV